MDYRVLTVFLCLGGLSVVALNTYSGPVVQLLSSLEVQSADEPAAEPAEFTERDMQIRTIRETDHYEEPEGRYVRHVFEFDGEGRAWHALVAEEEGPRPVIVLLHGSNRTGAAMIDMWQAAARSEGVHLIAPDSGDTRVWSDRNDGAEFIRAALNDATDYMEIDTEQVFLFGHSAGAAYGLALANGSDLPFRAVAAHGGVIREDITVPATPMPVRLYLGDNDHTTTLDDARLAGERLAERGHPTELVVLTDQSHWYYDIGVRLSYQTVQWFLTADVEEEIAEATDQ